MNPLKAVKAILDAVLGTAVEIIYSLVIIFAAFLICLALSLKT